MVPCAEAQHSREQWQVWVQGAHAATKRGDFVTAKRYYFGALTELEKKRVPHGTPLPLSVSRLEKGLIDLYPQDWSIDEKNPSKQLPLQEEQVAVFARLAAVAAKYSSPDNLSAAYVNTSYKKAVSDLQKTKAAIETFKGKHAQ